MSAYAELHALSNFSFLRGASHPAELVMQAHKLGYRALALTDECSMAGVVRAHEALRTLKHLKLIIGAEFHAAELHLVLLAPTQTAYAQLCALITRARRRAPKGRYSLSRSDFEADLDDCLALWIPPTDPDMRHATWLRDFFPARGWLAVELHRGAADATRLQTLLALAKRNGLPAVAAGDVHMHTRSRRRLQDVLTAIRHGCTLDTAGLHLYPNGERRLRSLAELQRIYPRELLAASVEIAERCNFSMAHLRYQYPTELVPAGKSAHEHLRTLTAAGMQQRWPQGAPLKVCNLIEKELALIADLGYEHFFLTVHDLVSYAREKSILCQGRGSAANSAVCYALGITEIDPARIEVLFERFISRERNEPPDIDVDFEHERREEVIQYIFKKYGRERAALAATVIMYRTRSAVRDVGKALGLPADAIHRIARLHTWWDQPGQIHEKLAQAGVQIDALRARLFAELVPELLGFPRHLSQHVGGFVISGEPLSALVPIENATMPERTVIQWDKDDLETLGLLKVDVLALGMLTAIRRTLDLANAWRGEHKLMQDIPSDDAATYDMICRGDTVGVFQIESRAQMSMLPRLQPRCYYDLVIEVAIVRPGPIQGGMVHPYLQRRKDPGSVQYPSPELKEVLKRTLGVPIFQEQVMRIAIVAADFTPGEADALRRAMAAWRRHGNVDHFRARLLCGMAKNGYTPEFAEQIYKQILGFGDYGFPESHAASFALLTYVSSWLKCHEPAAFIAGLMNSQPMGFYQPAQLAQEARRCGVTLLPPDALISQWDCTLEPDDDGRGKNDGDGHHNGYSKDTDQPAIRLGLRQVRGLPKAEAAHLIAARSERLTRGEAAFRDIDELSAIPKVSKRSIQALAAAGALRHLASHRHAANWQALGVERLPGLIAGLSAHETTPALPQPSESQEIFADYQHLGFTTGRHPLALLRPTLTRRRIYSSHELQQLRDGMQVHVGGLITHLQRPQTAAGVTFMSLEDETGMVNVIVWPQVFEAQRRAALESSLLVVSGTLQKQQGVIHIVAQRLHDASRWLSGIERRSRDFR